MLSRHRKRHLSKTAVSSLQGPWIHALFAKFYYRSWWKFNERQQRKGTLRMCKHVRTASDVLRGAFSPVVLVSTRCDDFKKYQADTTLETAPQKCRSKRYKNINACNGREMAEVTVISERRIQHGAHPHGVLTNKHCVTSDYKLLSKQEEKLLDKWKAS